MRCPHDIQVAIPVQIADINTISYIGQRSACATEGLVAIVDPNRPVCPCSYNINETVSVHITDGKSPAFVIGPAKQRSWNEAQYSLGVYGS